MIKQLNKGLALLLATVLALSLSGALITAFADDNNRSLGISPGLPGVDSSPYFRSLYFECGLDCPVVDCNNLFRLVVTHNPNPGGPAVLEFRLFQVYGKTTDYYGVYTDYVLHFHGIVKTSPGTDGDYTINFSSIFEPYRNYYITFSWQGNTLILGGYLLYSGCECQTIDIEVVKEWRFPDGDDVILPDLPIRLIGTANGQVVVERKVTLEGPDWSYSFPPLYFYYDDVMINWTVEEELPYGWIQIDLRVYEEKNEDGVVVRLSFVIVNELEEEIEPYENSWKDLVVVKEWDDNNNPLRPNSIQVELLRDGVVYTGIDVNPVTLSYPTWTFTFYDLHYVVDDRRHVFTVREIVPAGYDSTYELDVVNRVWTITNTLIPEQRNGNGPPPQQQVRQQPTPAAPKTGDLATAIPLLASVLLSVSAVLGGTSLKNRFRK